MSAEHNKRLVADAFDAWAKGEGTPFALLADDVVWTITGSSTFAGTYHGGELVAQVFQPLSARLAGPIRPAVEAIVAEDDTVVVMWKGYATALDGQPYDNRYCWVMRMEGDRAREVTAFLDTELLADLWDGVGGPSG